MRNATAARRKAPVDFSSEVKHALSTDPNRPHLTGPFGFSANGRHFVAGTDGHRAACVVMPEADARPYFRGNAPKLEHRVQWSAPELGELVVDMFADQRVIPRTWTTFVHLGPTGVEITTRVRRVKRKEVTHLYPFGAQATPVIGAGQARTPWAGGLSYLLDAFDFIGTGVVRLFGTDALEPIYLTPPRAKSLTDAERFALIMPVRT